MAKDKLVFSGIQPSGEMVHLGNYLGAMKSFLKLSDEHKTIVCVVDLHALTSVKNPELLRSYTKSLVAAYLAIGLDPQKVIIFRQSDIPEVVELAWYLACVFPFGLLERGHSIKDARAKEVSINSGVAFYPILMAADILLYRANLVPVGPDQKQHLEMARDVAEKFNLAYGETFPLPEPLISEAIGVIPGLDGRKMSKSYGNYIGLFEDSKSLKKKIMSIVTDSKGVEDSKDPSTCNIVSLYKHFATKEEIQDIEAKYREGGYGYGHAKLELLRVVERELAPMRDKYQKLIQDDELISEVLSDGAARARTYAAETMAKVRLAIGIN